MISDPSLRLQTPLWGDWVRSPYESQRNPRHHKCNFLIGISNTKYIQWFIMPNYDYLQVLALDSTGWLRFTAFAWIVLWIVVYQRGAIYIIRDPYRFWEFWNLKRFKGNWLTIRGICVLTYCSQWIPEISIVRCDGNGNGREARYLDYKRSSFNFASNFLISFFDSCFVVTLPSFCQSSRGLVGPVKSDPYWLLRSS